MFWDISLQRAGSLQLSVTGLHFALTFECQCGGRSTHLDTSLTILKGRVNENKKIMQQTKEEQWKIHQAFLVSVISVTSTDA